MYRIRFHGRGGQGMKTASRVLGTAFFLEGFEVQDAPRYGAERRGAPIFAYVRAAHGPIYERGVITRPDLVLVADDTLVGIPAAGVLAGVDAKTILLIAGSDDAETWHGRLQTPARIVALPAFELEDRSERPFIGSACAGAAARLVGAIGKDSLRAAIAEELGGLGKDIVDKNTARALDAYEAMAELDGAVLERPADTVPEGPPAWIDLAPENADLSAPAIHAGATSVLVRTGLWRTMRPVLEPEICHKCVWICGSFCPDGVISTGPEGYPEVDYDHCKGCLVCVAQCPTHAMTAVAEADALAAEKVEGEEK